MDLKLWFKLVTVTTIVLTTSAVQAKVYQCTDDKGQVSFSNLPCSSNEEKKMLDFTEAQGTVEVDEDTSYIDLDSASPMCKSSVENAHYTLNRMLDVGKRNYAGGYIEKTEYEEVKKLLKVAQRVITLKNCEKSTGADRAFFECMESGYTIMPLCAQEHNPPLLED